jgi:hypothetical protein
MSDSPFSDRRLANTVTWHLMEPKDFNMRIPDSIKKCVLYLGIDVSNSEELKVAWKGTCFYVSISSGIPNYSFNYLVTAKHCADAVNGEKAYLRANAVNGDSMTIEAKNGDIKWYYHPTDKAADVAITPLGVSQKIMDFLPLPMKMLLDEENRIAKGIGEGDEIFMTGLFVHHAGNSKNIPIVRTGNIAMTPQERIHTSFGEMEAYLIESRSIGGLSGSPVFVYEQTRIGGGVVHLLGLIHGHWNCSPETIIDESAEDSGIPAKLNMGIAIVTPAYKIIEVVNCPELSEMRNKKIAEIQSKNSPKQD